MPGNDLTLEDLANSGGSEAAEAAADAAAESAESGESLMELVEFMDERGYLQPLMFGLDNNDKSEPVEPSTENAPADADGTQLTAANIERLAARIQDEVGDVPISKIEAFASAQPDKVNALISQLENE